MPYTWSTFKDAVKDLLTDVARNDDSAVRAIADFVKAHIAREVDRDLNIFASHYAGYEAIRKRLLGYSYTGTDVELRAAVNRLITVDANRQGIQDFIDDRIAQAKNDIAQPTSAFDSHLRNAVVEIQSFIPFFRQGHLTSYSLNGVTGGSQPLLEDGEAGLGELPENAALQEAWFIWKYDDPLINEDDYADSATTHRCQRFLLQTVPWAQRQALFCGSNGQSSKCLNPSLEGYYISISPQDTLFAVYPKPEGVNSIELYWSGLKATHADADKVPYNEPMAAVVADYINSRIARQSGDFKGERAYIQSYLTGRTSLYLNAREQTGIKHSGPALNFKPMCDIAPEAATTETAS